MAPRTRARAKKENGELSVAVNANLKVAISGDQGPEGPHEESPNEALTVGETRKEQAHHTDVTEISCKVHASTKIVVLKIRGETSRLGIEDAVNELSLKSDVDAAEESKSRTDETKTPRGDSSEGDPRVVGSSLLDQEEAAKNTQEVGDGSDIEPPKETVTGTKRPSREKKISAKAKSSGRARGVRSQTGQGSVTTPEQLESFLETSANNEQAEVPKPTRSVKAKDLSGNNKVLKKAQASQSKTKGKKTKSKRGKGTKISFGARNIVIKPPKVHYTNNYQVKLGFSRYTIQKIGPTKEEVCQVFEVLRKHHAKDNLKFERDNAPIDGSATGPLHSSSELTVDAFVQTILSQTTTNVGALQAYWLLRRHYPYEIDGRKVMGKKPNYHAMMATDSNKLIEILRPAGLQNKKAYMIKNILRAVYDMNIARENKSVEGSLKEGTTVEATQVVGTEPAQDDAGGNIADEVADPPEETIQEWASPSSVSELSEAMSMDVPEGFMLDELSEVIAFQTSVTDSGPKASNTGDSPVESVDTESTTFEQSDEILRGDVVELPLDKSPDFVPGLLSVTHLQELKDQALFDELVSHEGVGVKTAFCIMAFNLGRPVFAVDTHVYRLCKFLGWSPEGLDENKTAEHLDVIVPNDIKYGLHQLFWHHGQKCVRCRSNSNEKSAGWDKGCPIEDFVDRSRYVPVETKAQKEKRAEQEAQKAKGKKATAKQQSKAKGKDLKSGPVTSQTTLKEVYKVVKTSTVTRNNRDDNNAAVGVAGGSSSKEEGTGQERATNRKRKVKEGDNGQQLIRAEDGSIRIVKKVKVEQPPADDDPDAEYAEIVIHDDFDAGRNQNITRTIRFKVPKFTV